jgi:hypothetical protein
MKNFIKSIALTALLVAGICQTSIMHAHPLEKLMPFVTRILWNSESFLSSVQGLWIKQLAEPYGLKCQYPVLVKKADERTAYAQSNHPTTGAIPKRDKLGRVILDITDKSLVKTENQHILFNSEFVKKHQKNHALLAAVLFHENKHLDENHKGQSETLKYQAGYAIENPTAAAYGTDDARMVLSNGLPVSLQHFNDIVLPGLPPLYEQEADSAIKEHSTLCRDLANLILNGAFARCFKKDLKKFCASLIFEDDEDNGQIKRGRLPRDKKNLDLYREACQGNRQAYELLEQIYTLTHPLAIRRHAYLLQWADEAEKNQIKEHPNLNDTWLNYCTRHITKLGKIKEQQS